MIQLRKYQSSLKTDIYDAWESGHKNVLAVMATGGGKTKLFCDIAMDYAIRSVNTMPTSICVHRKELVQQISLTLAEEGVMHNIIAPRPVIQGIVAAQRQLMNKQFYDYMAPITVVSVDTLNARILKHEKWAKSIRLWITDEAAHLLKDNKWGRAVSYFVNAKGLGVTATPQRLDKRGLGSHADGVFDVMVEGPNTRWLVKEGYLSKYKIAVPASDYQRYLKSANSGSDFSKKAMSQASHESTITGDVVENYIKFASGKQAIVFATDIKCAMTMEANFNAAGITAKLLTGLSTDKDRLEGMIAFREKKIQVLVNVDLFDEGLDVPGIECVIMARPTMSLAKYLQMCLDQETEVLTKRGWLKHDQINKRDIVATFNTVNKMTKWCPIQRIVKRARKPDEKMYSFKSPHLDFRVTSMHDMIVKSRSKTTKNWTKQTVNEMNKRKETFHLPVSSFDECRNDSITDAELSFLGWFLSHGTRSKYQKDECIRIYQASNAGYKLDHIRKTLKDCGFKWTEHESARKGALSGYASMIHFTIPFNKPKRDFKWGELKGCGHLDKWLNKSIPESYNTLSHDQFSTLLDSLNLGDGSKPKNIPWAPRTLTIACGDNQVMGDRLQALLVTKGFKCNLSVEDRSHLVNRKDLIRLLIKDIRTSSAAGENVKDGSVSNKKPYRRSRIEIESDYRNEIVWCITNEVGTIFTRRNGKVLVTGNCGRGLRPAPGKDYLIVIDHVGNVAKHGLPDSRRNWTLDRIIKRRDNVNFIRICHNVECNTPYNRLLDECPWCNTTAFSGGGGGGGGKMSPIEVDGDLYLIDPEVLHQMEEDSVLESPASVSERVSAAAGQKAGMRAMNNQAERIVTQSKLIEVIAAYAGECRAKEGLSDRQIHKKFYIERGFTISQALAEPKKVMLKLIEEIRSGFDWDTIALQKIENTLGE